MDALIALTWTDDGTFLTWLDGTAAPIDYRTTPFARSVARTEAWERSEERAILSERGRRTWYEVVRPAWLATWHPERL